MRKLKINLKLNMSKNNGNKKQLRIIIATVETVKQQQKGIALTTRKIKTIE